MKRKGFTQIITNQNSLSALIRCMQANILEKEEEIISARKAIISQEDRIESIRRTKKYEQTVISNVK